jgi:hypothetical protein
MPLKHLSRPSRKALAPRLRRNMSVPDPGAVPFAVTAFAAANFPPPAISDAIEETPVFDKSKAKRVAKTKARRAG